ncbi:MAG: GNAT family N-acetyltransferase [Pseudomonadota bacterium]
MLRDDPLGQLREHMGGGIHPDYQAAFDAIDRDPCQRLFILDVDGRIAGCYQLTFVPGLSRKGSWRAMIESVRVHSEFRDAGYGRQMVEHGIAQARAKGCGLVQLTSDKSRKDAIRFYERLGFVASHEGLKLNL